MGFWCCLEDYGILQMARPALLLIIALSIYHLPVFIHKLKLTSLGILYFLFCNDKKWKKPEDPLKFFSTLANSPEEKKKIQKKTIIFVRHGESTWNETFNKGAHRSLLVFIIGFIPNLIKALLYEFYLLLTGQMDSWFYDAPLSPLGLEQVDKLGQYLSQKQHTGLSESEEHFINILRGGSDASSSILISSNLRRAHSTMAAAFRFRLAQNPKEKILIVPSLQEISRNPDTLSITPAHEQVTASFVDRSATYCDFQDIFTNRTDMSLHVGNKPISTNGLKRMNEFCEYVFSLKEHQTVICGGHSIWFRYFFRTFLPAAVDHAGKNKKIVNGGCVAFTLMKAPTAYGDKFMMDPKSIVVVYGGFK